jgi:hypothetical protein
VTQTILIRGGGVLFRPGSKTLPAIGSPTGPPPPHITISAPAGIRHPGDTIALSGTVTPSGGTLGIKFDTQATTPPTTFDAEGITPAGNTWAYTAAVPSTPGTYYAWVVDETHGTSAVTTAITVAALVTGAISVNNISGTIHPGDAIVVSGTIAPSGATAQFQLSQTTTIPVGGWQTAVSNSSGVWSATVTAGVAGTWYVLARESLSAHTAVSAPFTITIATSSNVVIPYSVTNATDVTTTDPYHLGGVAFAPSDLPAGYYPKVTLADGVTELTDYQWNAWNTRKGSDKRFGTLRMRATGSFDAYGGANSKHSYKIIPTPGSGPSGTAISIANIIARSTFQVRVSGGDYAAELSGPSDYFYIDATEILTSFPRDTDGLGLNPLGGYRIEYQGNLETCVAVWAFLKRKSDGARHKWVKMRLWIHALKGGEFEIGVRIVQPNLYGPHPLGTIGPDATAQPNCPMAAQPRYAGFIEIWEAKSNRYVGGWGGLREERQFTVPATAFNSANYLDVSSVLPGWPSLTTYPVLIPTYGGPFPSGVGLMFAPADSSSTLPSNISPNRVYWAAYDALGKCWLCQERPDIITVENTGKGADRTVAWTANTSAPLNVVTSGVVLQRHTVGTTGTTAPAIDAYVATVNPPDIVDGTATWRQATVRFGTAGAGTIRIIPAIATFGNAAIDLLDSYGRRYWFDPANKPRPWTLGMPDFDYTTKHSRAAPPYEFFTPNPVPSTRSFRYIPNQRFTMIGRQYQAAWDLARAPGESEDDFRLGQWAGWAALQLYQPNDRNTQVNARAWAANFASWTLWGEDERTGYPPIVNLGPDRNGAAYPLMPAGTANPSIWWTAIGTSGLGAPKPIGVGVDATNKVYRHQPGFIYSYQQVTNGTHMPNPGASQYFLDGDPMWSHFQLTHAAGLLLMYSNADRNRTINGIKYCGLVVLHNQQPRGTGWHMCKMVYAGLYCPDGHPLRQYIDDCLDDQSAYLSVIESDFPSSTLVWGQAADWGPPWASLWNNAHQHEGMSLGAYAFEKADGTSERPGFLHFVNTVMTGQARIFDETTGGCTYYAGIYGVYFQDAAGVPFPDVHTMLGYAKNNAQPPSADSPYNLYQAGNGSFVCPGVGGTAPRPYPTTDPLSITPGVSLYNAIRNQPAFNGNAYADCVSIVMQNMAPLAIAGRCTGANPIFKRVWQAVRTRETTAPLVGPKLVGTTGTRPVDGMFMYAYTPL